MLMSSFPQSLQVQHHAWTGSSIICGHAQSPLTLGQDICCKYCSSHAAVKKKSQRGAGQCEMTGRAMTLDTEGAIPAGTWGRS